MKAEEEGTLARVRERAAAEQEAYSGEAERPLGQYARVMAVYAGAVGALALVARRRRVAVPRFGPYDLVVLGLATNRLSSLVSRDSITSPLRAPFTRYRGVSGPAQLQEEARGTGWRHTIGELLTCPFCVSQWAATGLVAGEVLAPNVTRLASTTLAAVALSDATHLGRAALQHAAS